MHDLALKTVGDVPFILIINKSDLVSEWEVTEEDLERLHGQGWLVLKTSAKEDHGVTEAFRKLAELMTAK